MSHKSSHKHATYQYRLTVKILLLALLAVLSCAWINTAIAQDYRPPVNIGLTEEEKQYLNNKIRITFVCDSQWPPFEFVDAMGRYSGMSADYLQLISNRIGIPFRLIQTKSWTEALESAKAGKSDIMPMLNETPERASFLNFTTPYFSSEFVIIGTGYQWERKGLKGMADKTVAVVTGYKMEEDLKRDYPNIQLVHAETMIEALKLVHEGKADATLSTILEASHIVRKSALNGLRILGKTEYINTPRMGVNKADIVLSSIMRKAVDSLTDSERKMIATKWIAEGSSIPNNRLFFTKAIGFILLGLAVAFFIYRKFK